MHQSENNQLCLHLLALMEFQPYLVQPLQLSLKVFMEVATGLFGLITLFKSFVMATIYIFDTPDICGVPNQSNMCKHMRSTKVEHKTVKMLDL